MAAEISVLTIVKGRSRQLHNQLRGLNQSNVLPLQWVVVGMGENPDLNADDCLSANFQVSKGVVKSHGEHQLPLAAARNKAASLATGEMLVFLDVDCIPARDLLSEFAAALTEERQLWMGSVEYLPPGDLKDDWSVDLLDSLAVQHPKLPLTESGDRISRRHEMFWSLCFSIHAHDFNAIGGFDESFSGYGAEDTDFAFAARAANIKFGMIGAKAYHQHHPVCKPPLNHFESIITNAKAFRKKWGTWPMESWLTEFERRGLVNFKPKRDLLDVLRSPTQDEVKAATSSNAAGF